VHDSDEKTTARRRQIAAMHELRAAPSAGQFTAMLPFSAGDGTPVAGVAAASLDAALAALGYAGFRPGQREAVETLLQEHRLLLVAPTGGGKSLTYQLPATLLGGTTLVISPLVSLMQDQVSALAERGVAATYLAATLDADELRRRMADLGRGRCTLAYVAPERLSFPGFRGLLRDLGCPLVAIDEAHCISEWGHDFRPDYLQIGDLLADLAPAHILACTATATPVVRDEILARLGLPADTPQRIHGFARPNLALRVEEIAGAREREAIVDEALRQVLLKPGSGKGTAIVYAPTRRAVDDESTRLARAGWKVGGYHAGLEGELRERVQRRFRDGELDVVVATNAFGMGIDRGDVRAVVHLGPPSSIEAYYQEVGRAGRDGHDAIGVLCVAPSDLPLRRRLIERPAEGQTADPAQVEHRWNLFLELMRWAEGGSCRHDAILRYFGDEAETLHGCGRCDICLLIAGGTLGDDDPAEVAVIVRKALSAVARVHGRFGLQAAVKLLKGASDPRLERSGLAATKTFGALRERSEAWLTTLIRRLVTAGWADVSGDDRPLVGLTAAGKRMLFAEGPVPFLLPRDAAAAPVRRTSARRAPAADDNELDAAATARFERLRERRMALAREDRVPPYVVASDRTLRELARLRPGSLAALEQVHGIGPSKAARYGQDWLDILSETG
jgi:ATP-dependent DNA helicase RecQ